MKYGHSSQLLASGLSSLSLLPAMATTSCSPLHSSRRLHLQGISHLGSTHRNFNTPENFKCSTKRNPIKASLPSHVQSTVYSSLGFTINSILNPSSSLATVSPTPSNPTPLHFLHEYTHLFALADLDPETAKLAIGILSPVFSAFSFLFIVRIVMSWYPKLPVGKFPYVLAYAPTEPILVPTRKVIPPLGGVDVTPVVWFALISFMNEILVGPQGLLRLLSQHV